MADLNENSDDPDLSEILNSNATYENDSDLLDIFSKSVPLDVFKLEPSSQLTTQVDVQSTQTGVVQKHLCTDNEDKSIVSTFKPDESMSTQDIVLAEHCYSRSGNDTFNDFDSASNLQIASPKQSKRNKRSDRNKDKNKPQDKGSKMKKKRGRKPKKGAEIKEESDAVLIDSTMNNDKIEDSSDDAKSSLYIKPEIKSEDLEVPFDKDGKLYGTNSKLTDNKKTDSSIKNENENEMEKTIIKEDASSANLSTPSYSGRSQRIRKKPKRWDDDQVEVDFTGQSNLFGLDDSKNKKKEDTKSEDSARKRQKPQTKVNNSKIIKKEETVEEEDSESSSDDNDNNDSNFSSDDDSDKLWCFCRKPYNERFMISCDACEEWFHGKCVNVTKVQGNKMEKLKQEWFCKSCLDGLENNVSREELKRLAEIKRLKIEEEERAAKAKKKKKTSKIKERKSTNKVIESTIIIREEIEVKQEDEMSSDHSDLDVSKVSQKSNKSPKVLKDLRKESKESEDRRKLQKLIKASKKDLNEKLKVKEERTQSVDSNMDQSEQSTTSIDQSQSSSTTNTNHVVPLTPTEEFPKVAVPVPKPKGELTPKKKHKTDPVDVSVQDLFKAEPVLMRSMSTSSASPSTSSSLSSHRKSSGSFELRRTSTSSTNSTLPVLMNGDEISCPSGCGKTIRMDLNDSNLSIYCNSNCLQTHVSDALKCLRSYKKHKDKDKSIPPDQQKPLRVVLYNRANGKIKSGKDALLEKDVLSFITKNPVFEVFKPNAITNSKANNVHNHHQQNSHKSAQSNTNNTSHKNNSSHKTQNDSKKSQSAVSSNNASSSSKLERSSSISERPDDRRKYLRKHLREIFDTRHKELNDNDKAKINPDSFSKLSSNIEEELYKAFKSNSHKYNNKSRSLIFNLKDHKNNLYRKVLLGRITPERLVNMSPEELASSELARWRENEKKTMIELIKRDAEDQANQIIVKKTHKGEEFITGNDLIELPLSEPANKNDSSKDLNSVEKLSSEATTKIAPASLASIKSEPILSCFDVLDTTSQHKHHVYSNNCKICIVKSTDKSTDKKTSVSATPPVLSSQISKESTDTQNHRSQPKRVRIELESTSKFLEEAVKLSDKLKLESQQTPLITSESSNDTNATTPVKTSPKLVTAKPTETKNPELGGSSKAIWKGTIFMQDVAKFVASAHNISGTIAANLLQDINDQITVCGRITPEQVCDYISKLRSSKRTEIGIVQFSWASREERTGYDAFFNYLNVRGRYGVVSYSGKTFKDFYILPLSHNQEIPKILHPIEGPGVAKKMHRPNLLLGILIRSRKFSPSHPTNIPLTSAVSQSTHDSVATSSTLPERSYTPPPLSNYETPLQEEGNTGSYTPPQMPPAKRHLSDSGSHDLGSKVPKYDPEETKVNTSKSSSAYMNDLMEKVASSSNPVEMTSSVLSAIATSDNYELQKRLLDQLTEKVEGQRRLLEKQKQETEDKISTNTSLSSLPNSLSSVAGSNSVSIDSVFNNIKNIQIPDNIKDILKTVQEKTSQIEAQQARLRAVSGSMNATLEDFDHPDPNSNNSNNDFLNKTAANDPRLRSKKATSIHTEGSSEIPPLPTAQPVASMSQDELLRKAQEQMAALAQMESDSVTPSFPHVLTEKEQKFVPPMPALSGPFREKVTPSAPLTKTTESRTSMPKISFQWKRKK